jgi:hypothetical protein
VGNFSFKNVLAFACVPKNSLLLHNDYLQTVAATVPYFCKFLFFTFSEVSVSLLHDAG